MPETPAAPTAENPQPGGAAPAAATSAPAATQPAPGAAETPQPSPEPKSESAPAEPKAPHTLQERVEFFKARKEVKSQLAEENLALKKRLETLERAPASAKPETPKAPDLLEDPDGWARGIEERAEKRALAIFQEREQTQRMDSERAVAEQWLLSQSRVREDRNFAEAVSQLLQISKADGGLLEAAQADPVAAAELAYSKICKAAGISGNGPGASAASAGVRPSAAPMGGKKKFTPGEGLKYINEAVPGTPEYDRRIKEVEEAG